MKILATVFSQIWPFHIYSVGFCMGSHNASARLPRDSMFITNTFPEFQTPFVLAYKFSEGLGCRFPIL